MSNADEIYVGIVADGSTDKEILFKLISVLFEQKFQSQPVFLNQNLRSAIDKFKRTTSHQPNERPFVDLKNQIVNLLFSAYTEFQSNAKRTLNTNDILIINTDAESHLNSADLYFKEPWVFCLSQILRFSIEEFYHIAISNRHYTPSTLPHIIPLMLFPSTEILVFAAKSHHETISSFYGKKASELKIELYGTTDLRTLRPDGLQEKALDYITVSACPTILKILPELKSLFRLFH